MSAVPAEPATPRDRGAQSERTALAWRRTALALVVGTLVVGRLTMDTFGPLVVVPAVLAAGASGWAVVAASRSRRLVHAHPAEPAFVVLRDGRLPAVLAAVAGALALAEVLSAVAALLGWAP